MRFPKDPTSNLERVGDLFVTCSCGYHPTSYVNRLEYFLGEVRTRALGATPQVIGSSPVASRNALNLLRFGFRVRDPGFHARTATGRKLITLIPSSIRMERFHQTDTHLRVYERFPPQHPLGSAASNLAGVCFLPTLSPSSSIVNQEGRRVCSRVLWDLE